MKTTKRKLVADNLLPGIGNNYKLPENITNKSYGYPNKYEIYKNGELYATIPSTGDIHSYDNEFDIELVENH